MQRETVCEESGEAAAHLVALDDFEGWRGALLTLRDDPAASAELGARARALVLRRFTLTRMIDGFENVILETENQRWIPAGNASAAEQGGYTRSPTPPSPM
jgi:glycosyltransferase involved in cell wall biosynthesis